MSDDRVTTTRIEEAAWRVARRAYAVVGKNALARAAQRAATSVLGRAGVVGRARLRDGDVLYVDIASPVGSTIWLRGVYDVPLVEWVTADLSPGDVFVDVGANVGYYTAIASRRVGSEGLVVAVEVTH
jgi:protein-L-isoaspartate O-methyltransferase